MENGVYTGDLALAFYVLMELFRTIEKKVIQESVPRKAFWLIRISH